MTRTDINNYQKASVERTNPQNAWVTLAAAPRRSTWEIPPTDTIAKPLGSFVAEPLGRHVWRQRNRTPFRWRYVVNDIDRLDWRTAGADRCNCCLVCVKLAIPAMRCLSRRKPSSGQENHFPDLIGNAGDQEEAAFMEAIILKSFNPGNPVYEIGKDYYTWRKTINDMARWMQYYYAPFLTEKQCIDRVRWCIELFNSAVFFTLKDELGFENAKTCEKDLKTSFETA